MLQDGADAAAWHPTVPGEEEWVALRAAPQDVERVGVMPAEGVLSMAPMGEYDVIELSVFAHPTARVRWRFDEEETGAIGWVSPVGDAAEPSAAVVAVLVEAALDEAWQEGAETATTLVPAAAAAAYEAAGWKRVEEVSRG